MTTPLMAFVSAIGLGGLHFSPYAAKRLGIIRLSALCRRRRALCLTYDDGPGAQLTPAVLDLLGEHSAPATFFLLGMRTSGQEKVLDRMQNAGHEVGTHSQQHLHAWKVAPWRAAADVRAGFDCLRSRLPTRPLFRPPYGKLVASTYLAARRQRARLAWWTQDSGDTWAALPSVNSIVRRVQHHGGGVVLLHDFDRVSVDRLERHQFVLDATRALLAWAGAEQVATLPMGQLTQ